jgi:hypothetical protein
MKLKTRLMTFTAAIALSASMAHAAIDVRSLADSYVAEGYSYVEVKVGPTQVKVEAVRAARMIEVVYDSATGAVIDWEEEAVDDDYAGLTGVEISEEDEDFEDRDDEDDEDDADEDDADEDDADDADGDDEDGEDDRDEGDDRGGEGGEGGGEGGGDDNGGED